MGRMKYHHQTTIYPTEEINIYLTTVGNKNKYILNLIEEDRKKKTKENFTYQVYEKERLIEVTKGEISELKVKIKEIEVKEAKIVAEVMKEIKKGFKVHPTFSQDIWDDIYMPLKEKGVLRTYRWVMDHWGEF